ncbi:MAG: hypothetical protein U0Q12_03030 [Vicinamibacterales bacterium]
MAVSDDLRSIYAPLGVRRRRRRVGSSAATFKRPSSPWKQALGDNLRRHLAERRLMPYPGRNQCGCRSLRTLSDRDAIATYGELAWRGRWLWRWKDRIDQAFMARYRANGGGSERSL